MDKNLEKVRLLARDLRDGKQFPRSPRETLADYVLAARAVDKCRAVLAGWEGEYHSNCPLDQRWLKFAEIDRAIRSEEHTSELQSLTNLVCRLLLEKKKKKIKKNQ